MNSLNAADVGRVRWSVVFGWSSITGPWCHYCGGHRLSTGEPAGADLLLLGHGGADRRLHGLLDPAADERHRRLQVAVHVLDGGRAVRTQRDAALQPHRGTPDLDDDRAAARAVGRGRAPAVDAHDL